MKIERKDLLVPVDRHGRPAHAAYDLDIDRAQAAAIRRYILEVLCPASSSPPATSWSAKKCG